MNLRALFFLLVVVAACTNKSYGPPLAPSKAGAGGRVDVRGPADEAKKAHMATIASLQERAIGPLLARSDKGALAAYVAGIGSGESLRSIVAIALGPDGAPRVRARVIAQTSADTSTLIVKRVEAEGGGYLVAWTSLTDRGEALTLVGVDDDGSPRASALELARTSDHIVWVEIVPTARGAVCVWAEEPPTGGANVLAQALESNGRPRGVPSRVVRGASSWQAVPGKDGVALATVASSVLTLTKLDDTGRVVGEPFPIAKNVAADMDMVRAGDSVVFAWTDHSRVDPTLVIAGVDSGGKLVAEHDAVSDAGSSSLVGMAGGESGALVLWENSHKRERSSRRVRAASLHDASAQLNTQTTLDLAGGLAIEARARGDGWGLMVSAKACALGGERCGGVAPTFVRLDAALSVVQTEALVLGPPVSLAWSLDCGKTACVALAAGPDAPTSVYAVDLRERASAHAAPVAKALPEDAPRLASTTTLASGAQVGDVASARAGDTTLVASIVMTGTDEKTHEEKNALRITAIAAGKALATTTLSARIVATGGVAMTSVPSSKDAVVAYVTKDGAGARVHVARIDDHGARKADSAIGGGAKGDASDVSIVAVEGGFVVAWADTRDGNGEVYVAKIGSDLGGAHETRITNAPGDATDTALATFGTSVILAWADPRESPHDGFADIYAIALSPRDAKPLGKEGRVLSTAAHSRSPSLARTPEGAALVWIEEAPAGAASEEAKGAMFALLDEKARPVRDPIKLRMRDEGTVTAITLDADSSTHLVHAIAARTSQDELWLDAARIPLGAGALESYPLLALDGPSSLDVALTLREGELFFSDDGPDAADARVRRASIVWKK